MSSLDDGSLNLNVVNEAYGIRSDLYLDVLQVEPTASANEIQEAFFERRSELFRLLTDIDSTGDDLGMAWPRQHAERKLDAVVYAVRILGDPVSRLRYDDIRIRRMRFSPSLSRLPRTNSENSQFRDTWENMDSSQEDQRNASCIFMNDSSFCIHFFASSKSDPEGDEPSFLYARNPTTKTNLSPKKLTPPHSYLSPLKTRNASGDGGRTQLVREVTGSSLGGDVWTQISNEFANFVDDSDDFENDESFYTVDDESAAEDTQLKSSFLPNGGVFDRLHEEVLGVYDDIFLSLEQVLNAFSLQEADIKAVAGRIVKAKRQMAKLKTTSITKRESLKDRGVPFFITTKSSTVLPSISRRRELH